MKRFIIVALVAVFVLGIVFAQSTWFNTLQIKKAVVVDSLRVGGTLEGTTGGTPIMKIVKDTDLLIITAADTFVVDSVRAK